MRAFQILYSLILLAFLTSCEDVIDVDLSTASPRMVVEASINWVKGSAGNQQEIKLSLTSGYFEQTYPSIDDAVVTVYGPNGEEFAFIHQQNGVYSCSDFIPVLNGVYQLEINWQGTSYTATETLTAVADIATITQNSEGGFLGDQYEVRIRFLDPANQTNYYLTRFDVSSAVLPDMGVLDDTFFNGNYGFSVYSEEDLAPGDTMRIQLAGISSPYYQYMRKVLDIAGNAGGSPFSTPPATVRGNIRNTADPQQLILGYFRLSEVDQIDYIVAN